MVTNTPKTLGELLPQLMAIIIESLADPGAYILQSIWFLVDWDLQLVSLFGFDGVLCMPGTICCTAAGQPRDNLLHNQPAPPRAS